MAPAWLFLPTGTPVDRTLGGVVSICSGVHSTAAYQMGQSRAMLDGRFQRVPSRGILLGDVCFGARGFYRRYRGWGLFPMVCCVSRSAGAALLSMRGSTRICCGFGCSVRGWLGYREQTPVRRFLALVILEPPSYVA